MSLDFVRNKMEEGDPKRKRNIMELSMAELENDIDYIIHVDHEMPMEQYLNLEALKKDLANLIITHVDASVKRSAIHLKGDIMAGLHWHMNSIIDDSVGLPKVDKEVVENDPTKNW